MRSHLHEVASAAALAVLVGLVSAGEGAKKAPPAKKPAASTPVTARELARVLEEPLPTEDFVNPMSLKDALGLMYWKFKELGKNLPILIDTNAFKEANAEAADPYDAQVKLPAIPQQMPVSKALWLLIGQIPTNDGAYFVRNGVIVITTRDRAKPAYLLNERVMATFEDRPLDEALTELAERTGVTILFDPRLKERVKAPVTAVLRHSVTVGNAVRLLAEMADLQVVNEDDVLFITGRRPERGEQPAKEGARLEFRNRRIDEALKELAAATKTSIVLDANILRGLQGHAEPNDPGGKRPEPQAALAAIGLNVDETQPPTFRVTASFQPNVRAESATRILAAMTGLSVVVLGDALYVTSPGVAQQMQAELNNVAPQQGLWNSGGAGAPPKR